jgi:hypothetical protein
MRVQHWSPRVTLAAAIRLFRLNRHVAHVIMVLDLVAGDASALQRGMNVVSSNVVSMALDAVRMLIYASGMRTRVAPWSGEYCGDKHSRNSDENPRASHRPPDQRF